MKRFIYMKKGFTLIELLVVIAVIGVLAAVIITVLNPIEQIAKGNDVGRTNSVSQLGKAVELYYLANNNTYPLATNWQNYMMTGLNNGITGTGDIKQLIVAPSLASGQCTANVMGNICYATSGADAVVWTVLESSSEKKIANCATGNIPVVAWIASQGKTGLTCASAVSAAPSYTATLN